MGLFSSKKKVYVSGGISRIRPDELIQRTTGYVITGALAGNQNISDALTINAITGTVGSYKSFWRKAEKKYGLPVGEFSYFAPDKEQLAATIRTDVGQTFPTSDEIKSIDVSTLDDDFYVKYKLQFLNNYNVTTNTLTYENINYTFEKQVKNTNDYTIHAFISKINIINTTISYKAFYDTGLAKWRVKKTTFVYTETIYTPSKPNTTNTTYTYTYSDYDSVGNPAGIGLVIGTVYSLCGTAPYIGLCTSRLSYSFGLDTITFNIDIPVLPVSELIWDEQTTSTIEIIPEYWKATIIHEGREYYWFANRDLYPVAMGTDTDLPDELSGIFGSWAPVVPIRNDYISYKLDNQYSTEYKKSKSLLKIIGLDIDDLLSAIEEDSSDPDNPVPNPDLNSLADAYVSLHSKLGSNNEDELAYNFNFFNKLKSYGWENLVTTFDGDSGTVTNLEASASMYVRFSNIYGQRISWTSITSKIIPTNLTKNYTATLTKKISSDITGVSTITYVIRKKINNYSYTEITVNDLSIGFVVFFTDKNDNTVAKTFSPDFDGLNDPDEVNQWVIPVSLKLAKEAVAAKDLETFFLRTTYVGVFSRQVVKVKWYQQSWFKFLLIVIAIVSMNPQAIVASLSSTGVAVAGFLGVSVTAGSLLAIAIGLATYAVISIALKKLLTLALKAVGGNEFLEAIVKIIYVVVNVMIYGGKSLFKDIVLGANSFLDTLKTELELATLELKELSLELEKLVKEVDKLTKFENAQVAKEYALEIYNMFAGAGEQMTEHDMNKALLLAESPEYLYSSIENAKRLPEPYESYLNADRLVIA